MFGRLAAKGKHIAFTPRRVKAIQESSLGPLARRLVPGLRGQCTFFPDNLVILADGDITTCCIDFLGKNAFGNVEETSVRDLYNTRVKDIVKKGLYVLPSCRTCLGGPLAPYSLSNETRSRWLKRADLPLRSLQVELVARCNYDCCSSNQMRHYRRKTKADLDKIFVAIHGVLPELEELYFFNNGEPLLHQDFCSFVSKCRANAPRARFHISTNGMLLSERVAECMVDNSFNNVTVSVHGGPGTENMLRYSKYGADYDRILENVKRVTSLRDARGNRYPEVELKAVLFNWNDSDELMDILRRDAKLVGASRVFWVLDWNGPEDPRASKRFFPGSPELRNLVRRGEFLQFGDA